MKEKAELLHELDALRDRLKGSTEFWAWPDSNGISYKKYTIKGKNIDVVEYTTFTEWAKAADEKPALIDVSLPVDSQLQALKFFNTSCWMDAVKWEAIEGHILNGGKLKSTKDREVSELVEYLDIMPKRDRKHFVFEISLARSEAETRAKTTNKVTELVKDKGDSNIPANDNKVKVQNSTCDTVKYPTLDAGNQAAFDHDLRPGW